jgi:polysaccharide chain length determinant protein (PEP-CTERM system associated)
MSDPTTSFGPLVHSVLGEAKRRVLSLAVVFAVVGCAALLVGLNLPKAWESSALLVPDASAIKPLVEGPGGGGSSEGRLAALLQAVQTRKIMEELLESGGWPVSQASPEDQERMLARLKMRLRIEGSREGTIRIRYGDRDPKRTFDVTNKMVEIVIREAASAKETASREAYEFVERQVKEYGSELSAAHEKLLAYYRGQGIPTPAPKSGDSPERPAPERSRGRMSPEELAALRAEESTLAAQLARDRPTAAPSAEGIRAEEQVRGRVEQLRVEYERLANSYTEQHPDVVRKGKDLAAAREDLRQLEAARLEKEKARAATSALDDEVSRAARARLDEVRAQIASATGQPIPSGRSSARRASAVARPLPPTDTDRIDPGLRRVGQDSKLSELLRRYETTRDVYQDLLKKRETARLVMNLDVERHSVVLKIQEPPVMPVIPTSTRMLHKGIVGIVLAAAVPLALLAALVAFDGRVRSSEQIERLARVPILVSIPYAPSAEENRNTRLRTIFALLIVLAVFAVYIVALLLNRAGIIR